MWLLMFSLDFFRCLQHVTSVNWWIFLQKDLTSGELVSWRKNNQVLVFLKLFNTLKLLFFTGLNVRIGQSCLSRLKMLKNPYIFTYSTKPFFLLKNLHFFEIFYSAIKMESSFHQNFCFSYAILSTEFKLKKAFHYCGKPFLALLRMLCHCVNVQR